MNAGEADQGTVTTPPEPLLVRLGVRYFRSRASAAQPVVAADAVHVLNADERASLRRIQRVAVWRAAAAGALSTIVAAIAEVLAQPLLGAVPSEASTMQQVHFYAVVGAVTVVASIVEILFLYWDGLRAVHELACAAGLDLFPTQSEDKVVAAAMARAALELPTPNAAAETFGVNPWREASRARLVVASVVYKLKVSVTNFAIKAVIRRMLGRAFVRAWLPFVAVPITALWNAWVCWLIMREARIVAMGPSAARELVGAVLDRKGDPPSDEVKHALLRAVASAIVRTENPHPNLLALLAVVEGRVGCAAAQVERIDDTHVFLASLARLAAAERLMVLRMLVLASILDGRLSKRERLLLSEAAGVCERPLDLARVERLRRTFMAGDALEPEALAVF